MKNIPVKAKDYKKLLHKNSSPAYIFDAETFAFIEVNKAACEMYGYSPDEFLSLTVMDLHLKENHDKVRAENIMLNNLRVYYGNWTHKKKNGELIPVKVIRDKIIFQDKDAWFVTVKLLPVEK
ncbi:MAG: PAS domain-containing protein [Bacteroidia bacterium]